MVRNLICAVFLTAAFGHLGCASSRVPAIRISDEPGTQVQRFPGGETARYEYADGSYSVYYPSGRMMFRASGWNGREIEPLVSWLPFRGVQSVKHFWFLQGYGWVFDYGFPPGKIIRWGSHNLYEGWYESGRRMYFYDFAGNSYMEWNSGGKLIETGKLVSENPIH